LHATPDIIRAIKSRRKRCVENVARMGNRRGAYRFFYFGNLKERDNSEDLGVDRTILK